MSPFEASLRMEGGAAVIDLTGLLDRSAEEAMADVFGRAMASGQGPIVLNFSGIEYINSTGIALVVAALAKARAAARTVRAYGLTEHYREIFTITRLADFMGIFDNELTAVGGTET